MFTDNIGLFLIPELQDYAGFYLLQEKVKTEVEQLASSEGVIIVDEGLVLHHLLCPPAGVTTEETLV
nr:hypothetical protein BaRGS_009515 [Batillaria attramentaria]KAG5692308.1 hypothetical protein BaRGS_009518 [Batillaria attramentaria]